MKGPLPFICILTGILLCGIALFFASNNHTHGKKQPGDIEFNSNKLPVSLEKAAYETRPPHQSQRTNQLNTAQPHSNELKSVIIPLLENGYGMDVIQPAIHEIDRVSKTERIVRHDLLKQGFVFDLEAHLKERMRPVIRTAERQLGKKAGIWEDELVKQLMELRTPEIGYDHEDWSKLQMTEKDLQTEPYLEAKSRYASKGNPGVKERMPLEEWMKRRIKKTGHHPSSVAG